jgi:hypothetical protein
MQCISHCNESECEAYGKGDVLSDRNECVCHQTFCSKFISENFQARKITETSDLLNGINLPETIGRELKFFYFHAKHLFPCFRFQKINSFG